MVGAVDRSRNPNLDLVIVSGLNETVFPAPPERPLLLNESDRAALEGKHFPGMNSRSALGYERFLGYIAMTRARHRLVLTWSAYDPTDSKLNPSSFIGHVRRLFPQLEVNEFRTAGSWIDAEHLRELAPTLLGPEQQGLDQITASPTLAAFRERLRRFRGFSTREELSPEVAARLYGRELCTSVTSLERFAACPFKFFVHSGLRAQERKLFEVDQRKVGDFQHQVLKAFHEEITANGLRWRDVQPTEARKRMSIIAERLAATFSHGLFTASPRQRFAVHQLSRALQDFIEVIVGWMAQYEFDPVAVELRFHDGGDVPPWRLQLGGEQALAFTGSIDRVDMLKLPDGTALCVVVDYKSSSRRIDALLLANGIQLQLPAYLSVLRHCAHTKDRFNVERFIPAGVFYVSLKGDYKRGTHRDAVLAEAADARRVAYRHFGCFDASRLKHLDNNPWMVDEPVRGEQFNFKTTKSGDLHKSFPDAMESAEFSNLLDNIEDQLRNMGRRIFTGEAALDPYRHNSFVACDHCDYQSICRIDRWTHVYRALKEAP
jgi:ATP-dependent helicase/nuclease subunit B